LGIMGVSVHNFIWLCVTVRDIQIFSYINTLGTGYLNCLYAYKCKSASPVLNVLSFVSSPSHLLRWCMHDVAGQIL
jgi:hypothetical protein